MFYPHQIGLYFHWPFCKSKCPYCDFNVHIHQGEFDHERWAQAYITAIEYYARMMPEKQVVSVFFGGGTPSLMAPETVEKILNTIQKNWRVVNDLEVTLEANPTSVEAEKFAAFKAAGVNRVSLGVQSLSDSDLQFLGRTHDVAQALKAIEIAGRIFDRFSFDLIYARPNQSLKAWEAELQQALRYARGHLSLYQLTIERNTPFYMRYHRSAFTIPDDVLGADFYILTQEILAQNGLPAYEISNHAAVGQECRHNLLYWYYGDYIGIGAGAHGRYTIQGQKFATRDHAAPQIWLDRVEQHQHGAHKADIITPQDRFAEILMMGLRLKGGISFDHIQSLSGMAWQDGINSENLSRAQKEGWVIATAEFLSLSLEGALRFNSLLPYILR